MNAQHIAVASEFFQGVGVGFIHAKPIATLHLLIVLLRLCGRDSNEQCEDCGAEDAADVHGKKARPLPLRLIQTFFGS